MAYANVAGRRMSPSGAHEAERHTHATALS